MPEETRETNGRLEHPSVRFEKTDASLPAILTIMVCSLLFAGLIHLVVWFYFMGYSRQLAVARQSQFPLAPTPSTTLPPEPRLEQLDRLKGDAAVNVFARQKAKEAVLRRYDKADEAGYVRIPIDTAMKHMAGKLPVRKDQPKGPHRDLGLVDAGEPNSGRELRKEPR
jgi:hypothetical protein